MSTQVDNVQVDQLQLATIKTQNAVDAFAGVQYPAPSLEQMVRDVNRLLISLSAKKMEHLYKMMDALDAERELAIQVTVGKYKDKTVFWISMAGCGLQGFNILAIAAPQVLPGIAQQINTFSPFGNVINLNRFREVNELGVRVFNYNKISEAAKTMLNVPVAFVDPFRELYKSSLDGDRTESQSAADRIKELASQKRQECNQEIQKEEEAFRNARERERQEEQARETMVR